VAEITSWKTAADPNVEGTDRMVAYRKSADVIQGWSKEAEAKADVQRNPQLLRQ
jgi:hypothetical protein